MSETKRIKTALVSVYHKEGLDEIKMCIRDRSKVTCRAHCRLPPDRIAHTRQRCVVVGGHILKDRNKLVAQADVECRILRLQLLEGFRRVAKYVEREFERCKTCLLYTSVMRTFYYSECKVTNFVYSHIHSYTIN